MICLSVAFARICQHLDFKMTRTYTEEIFELTCPYDNQYQGIRSRYLFVCSAGMLRSPTGAAVATKLGYNARSCGSAEYALIPISVNLVHWAHKIFFVEERNYLEALDIFTRDIETQNMIITRATVLEIDDVYEYMHPTLVNTFEDILK